MNPSSYSLPIPRTFFQGVKKYIHTLLCCYVSDHKVIPADSPPLPLYNSMISLTSGMNNYTHYVLGMRGRMKTPSVRRELRSWSILVSALGSFARKWRVDQNSVIIDNIALADVQKIPIPFPVCNNSELRPFIASLFRWIIKYPHS